jgi:phage shock protein A
MIFKRIRDIVLAGVHDTLDSLECPESLVKQYIRDVEEEIVKAERAIAYQIVLEKRQTSLIEDTKAGIAKRARQAQLAVDTGEEEIAKAALQDKVTLESRLTIYEQQLETIQIHTATLTEQVQELHGKYQEMKAKQRLLFARANAAKTHQNLAAVMHTIDADSAVRGFARMEERVELWEAKAEASQMVLSTRRKLDTLNTDTTLQDKVESELAKLKAAKTEE